MTIRRLFWPTFGLCILLAALILATMPAEKTLGQVIKIVYFHGALSRAGMIGIIAAGIAGLLYLLGGPSGLVRWSHALLLAGWTFWTAHFIVSIPATRLAWGPWVAWGEPRVLMTIQVFGAGLVVIMVSWLLQNARFTAGANLLLGAAFALLALRTGVLRHPLDPIATSPSPALRLVYAALLVPVITALLLVAWRWAGAAWWPKTQTETEAHANASGGLK